MADNEAPVLPSSQIEVKIEAELNELVDEILADVEKNVQDTNRVKCEPNTNQDDEDINPEFFDEILQRAEEEKRQAGLAEINAGSVKRERTNENECDDLTETENEENETSTETQKSQRQSQGTENNVRSLKRGGTEIVYDDLTETENEQNEDSTKTKSKKRKVSKNTSPPKSIQRDPPRIQVRNDLSSASTSTSNDKSQKTIEEKKPVKVLTHQEKLCKALENIMYAKKSLKKAKEQKDNKFYPNNPVFAYTSTVRKLPRSICQFTQQNYENRSPLHTVNNVSFQFNSISTRLNLQEWGLETLPSKSKQIARALGFDVNAFFDKRQSIKLPEKIRKGNRLNEGEPMEETCEQTKSTLFVNAMVQTDKVKILPTRRNEFYIDVDTQTSGTYTGPNNEELPLFNMIRELNENQLQAVDDFVQFIKEPRQESSTDLYQQRKRLIDIYNISQLPSEISSFSSFVPTMQMQTSGSSLHPSRQTRYMSGFNHPTHPTPPPPPNLQGYEIQTSMMRTTEPPQPQPLFRNEYMPSNIRQPRPQTSHNRYYGRGGHRR